MEWKVHTPIYYTLCKMKQEKMFQDVSTQFSPFSLLCLNNFYQYLLLQGISRPLHQLRVSMELLVKESELLGSGHYPIPNLLCKQLWSLAFSYLCYNNVEIIQEMQNSYIILIINVTNRWWNFSPLDAIFSKFIIKILSSGSLHLTLLGISMFKPFINCTHAMKFNKKILHK